MKFSVIIPTYNRADLLDRCLQSLVDQSYKDFEVIVCDDGSTDNSKEITNKYQNNLNIQYLWNENWGGPARPRNNGIAAAQGEWICFLDSDDWWKPNKLQECLPYLDNYDIIYHSLEKIGNIRGEKESKERELKNNIVQDLLINGNTIPNSSVVIRKTIVDKVGPISEDRNLIAVEDYDYWLRAAQVTEKFAYINKVLGYYWLGNNISGSVKQAARMDAVYEKHKSQLSANDQYRVEKELSYSKARLFHLNGYFKEAKANYFSAISPNNPIKRTIKIIGGIILCLIHYRR